MNQYIQLFFDFFNHPFFVIFGGISASVVAFGFLCRAIFWMLGISPIVIRLGTALWRRRVAIIGSFEAYESLRSTIVDSGIFNSNKVIHIELGSIEKAKSESIFLVDWKSSCEKINDIFSARKNHQTAVIIFASPGSIPPEQLLNVADRPNTVIVNFKGRLLNDILTCLLTTSYDTK
jgi:hypothetical protein